MKVLGLFFLLATVGQLTAQRSDFVEYLLQLQYVAEPLHQHITNYLTQARATLSTQLTGLNDDSVHEITSGLRRVISIRDTTDETVAGIRNPNNEACVNNAVVNWERDLTTSGEVIAQCAGQHVDPIYTQTEEFHLFIQEHNRLAFSVQNMVLSTFTDLNPLTDFELLTPHVSDQIDSIFEDFETNVRAELDRRLAAITELRNSVPGQVRDCVIEGVDTLDSAAQAIVAAVRAC